MADFVQDEFFGGKPTCASLSCPRIKWSAGVSQRSVSRNGRSESGHHQKVSSFPRDIVHTSGISIQSNPTEVAAPPDTSLYHCGETSLRTRNDTSEGVSTNNGHTGQDASVMNRNDIRRFCAFRTVCLDDASKSRFAAVHAKDPCVFRDELPLVKTDHKIRWSSECDLPPAYDAVRGVSLTSDVSRRHYRKGKAASVRRKFLWASFAVLLVLTLSSTVLSLYLFWTVLDFRMVVGEQSQMLQNFQDDLKAIHAQLAQTRGAERQSLKDVLKPDAGVESSVTDGGLAYFEDALKFERLNDESPVFAKTADASRKHIEESRPSSKSRQSLDDSTVDNSKQLEDNAPLSFNQFFTPGKTLQDSNVASDKISSRARRNADFEQYIDVRIREYMNALPRVHLRGLERGATSHTVGSGVENYLLWKQDPNNFHRRGVSLQHDPLSSDVKAIVINEPGIYFVYSAVVLNGTSRLHNSIGCSHETVEMLYSGSHESGNVSVLMASYGTQDGEGLPYHHASASRSSHHVPKDTVLQVGLFRLHRQSQIRVRIPPNSECHLIDFYTDFETSSFGLFKVADT